MSHKIVINSENGVTAAWRCAGLVRRAICAALDAEGVYLDCEVSVLFTDDEGIRAINKDMRSVDSATDVLSFPSFSFTPGDFRATEDMLDEETGLLPLGDMALSAERIKAQAEEFGHSVWRETAYLVVHSVLHLLGYDHLDEGEQKAKMREREEAVMAVLHLEK